MCVNTRRRSTPIGGLVARFAGYGLDRPDWQVIGFFAGGLAVTMILVGIVLSVTACHNQQISSEWQEFAGGRWSGDAGGAKPVKTETTPAAWLAKTFQTSNPVGDSVDRRQERLTSSTKMVRSGAGSALPRNTEIIEALTPDDIRRIEAALAEWCHIRPSESERQLLADAQDGCLKDFDLLTAAMIAGGSPPQKVKFLLEKFDGQLRRIQARTDRQASPIVRVRQAFRGLHAEILHGGYDIAASNPGEAIQTGRYNCVSATLLFKLIAESLSFEVRVVQTPTHAYCLVKCGEDWVPVECTCPNWFDQVVNQAGPGGLTRVVEKSKDTEIRNTLGHPMVSKSQRPEGTLAQDSGRAISDTQLLGTIYYNRGVASLLEQQYETAVVVNLRAIQLDAESRSAWDNLLAGLNNWAIALAERGELAEAAARLQLALACRPDSEPIQANLLRVYREWANKIRRQGDNAAARSRIKNSIDSLPDDGRWNELRRKVLALLAE
jgi:hypothetical protein